LEEKFGDIIDIMNYKTSLLPNGLRLLVVPLPNLESASVTLWVKVGSRYEKEKVNGISHFLEHMPSKGTRNFPNAYVISHTTDAIGAETNAGTSREWTNFYIKSQKGQMETAFKLLSDMVLYPLLRSEDIDRERGVILEEIAMKNDSPQEKIGDMFFNLCFAGSPLGKDILGEVQSVKSISKSDFVRYRKSYYYAENMLLTVSGGVDEKEVETLAKKYFAPLQKGSQKTPTPFVGNQTKPQLHLEYKKTEQAHFFLGFFGYDRNDPRRFAETLLATVLGRGMSSRLFMEIRENRGLAYSVGSTVSRYVDTGIFFTYAGVRLKSVEEALRIVLDQHYGIANGVLPITDDELNKAKEYMKGRTALALEDTLVVNDFFGQMGLFMDEICTPEEVFDKIDAVTIEDVVDAARDIFIPERLNLALIGPYKSEEKFGKIINK
jgi:predicted Zn-dependent peptidase